MKKIALELAKAIAHSAENEALKNNWTVVVTIVDDGQFIGAIGVSGGTAQQDGVVAKAALEALDKK